MLVLICLALVIFAISCYDRCRLTGPVEEMGGFVDRCTRWDYDTPPLVDDL